MQLNSIGNTVKSMALGGLALQGSTASFASASPVNSSALTNISTASAEGVQPQAQNLKADLKNPAQNLNTISDDSTPLWAKVYECEYDADCGDKGQCVEGPTSRENPNGTSICECDDGYVNDPKTGEVCDYKQNKQLTQTLVSWFVGPLGVDWFLNARGNADYNAAGAMKLLMSPAAAVVGGGLGAVAGSTAGGMSAGAVVGAVGQGAWYLADAIRTTASTTNFPDGNGVPLKPF